MAQNKQKIVIDDEDNDDWMKKLPTYKEEAKIHAVLAKKLKAEESLAKAKALRDGRTPPTP